jgi:hypothetical protein
VVLKQDMCSYVENGGRNTYIFPERGESIHETNAVSSQQAVPQYQVSRAEFTYDEGQFYHPCSPSLSVPSAPYSCRQMPAPKSYNCEPDKVATQSLPPAIMYVGINVTLVHDICACHVIASLGRSSQY